MNTRRSLRLRWDLSEVGYGMWGMGGWTGSDDGATSVFAYQRSGDTLTLTQVRTPSGPSPAPVTIKLVRVE